MINELKAPLGLAIGVAISFAVGVGVERVLVEKVVPKIQHNSVIVSNVKLVEEKLPPSISKCLYTFSQRDEKGTLQPKFTSESSCGLYEAGNQILLCKGYKEKDIVKKSKGEK